MLNGGRYTMLLSAEEIIDLSLFAHIHNDAHLAGSRELTGNNFKNTIGFLLEYTKACERGETTFSAKDLQYIKPLLEKLKTLQELNGEILSLRRKTQGQELDTLEQTEITREFAEEVTQKILAFPTESKEASETNSLLMPGGWQNASGGHALVYEFKKDKNGNTIFLIHNTGAGLLEYHQTILQQDKERICPVKAYLIPKEAESSGNLTWFIQKLLTPQLVLAGKAYDATDVYKIFELIRRISGAEVDPIAEGYTKQNNLTAGQRSGTCSEKVLHQMSESAFPDKETYKRFIYGFKKFSLTKFSEKVERKGMLDAPGVRNQISLSIENTARLLEKEKYFDPKAREEEFIFLKEMQARFVRVEKPNALPLSKEKMQSRLDALAAEKDTLGKFSLQPKPITVPPAISETVVGAETKIEKETIDTKSLGEISSFNYKSEEMLKALQRFSEDMKVLRVSDLKAGYAQLENFFVGWPLPPQKEFGILKETLAQLKTADEKKLFFKLLDEINEQYSIAKKQLMGDQLPPKYHINQLGFFTLVTSLQSAPPFSLVDEKADVSFLDSFQEVGSTQIEKQLLSPYVASEDFQFDNRLSQARGVLLKKSIGNRRVPDYWDYENKAGQYLKAIIRHSGLMEPLEKLFNSEKIDKSKCSVDNIKSRKAEAIYTFQLYLDATDENKKKFIEQCCELDNIVGEERASAVEKFHRLEVGLQSQHQVELLLAKTWSSISNKPLSDDVKSEKLKIVRPEKYDPKRITYEPFFNIFIKESDLSEPKTLKWKKQSVVSLMLDEFTKNIFNGFDTKPMATPNAIQFLKFIENTEFKAYLNSEKTVWIRALMHLRTGAFQLPLTCEFFSKHMDFVKDLSKQVYLEKCLFHPEYLIQALESEPDTIQNLKHFIKSGIEIYTKGNVLTQPALFFMKLDSKLALYALDFYKNELLRHEKLSPEYANATKVSEEITFQLKGSLEKINRLLLTENITAREKSALHLQRAILLNHFLKQTTDSDEKREILSALIESLVLREHYYRPLKGEDALEEDLVESENLRVIRQNALSSIMAIYKDNNSKEGDVFLKKVLSKTLSQISMPLKEKIASGALQWDIKLPYIHLLERPDNASVVIHIASEPSNTTAVSFCSINLETSKVKTSGLLPSELPDSILNTKAYQKLFGNFEPVCLSNLEGTFFEFEYKNSRYRIITKAAGEYAIQCQFNILEQGSRWYEVQDIQQFESLQTIFKENRNIAWVSVEESNVFSTEKQILIKDTTQLSAGYLYQSDSDHLIALDPSLNATGYKVLQPTSILHKIVEKFEDPKFVIGLQKGDEYRIELPRYNINLIVKPKQKTAESTDAWSITLEGEDYTLDLSQEREILAGLPSPLVFKKGTETRVVIPIQRFLMRSELDKTQPNLETTKLYAAGTTAHALAPEDNESLPDPSERFKKPKPFQTPVDEEPIEPFTDPLVISVSTIPSVSREPVMVSAVSVSSADPITISTLQNAQNAGEFEVKKDLTTIHEVSEIKEVKETTEYHELVQDTGDYFRQGQFDAYKDPKKTKNVPIEQYRSNEFFIDLKRENNELIPKNMEDGLYLSYIYLAKQQPEKAFKTLEYCEKHFRQLSGTEKELDYLRWIVYSLPARIKLGKSDKTEEKTEEKADLLTPEVLAIKLKALSILALFKVDNPDFTVDLLKQSSDAPYDQVYKATQSRQRESFLNNTQANINSLYHTYHHTVNQVSPSLRLSEHERLQLLRAVFIENSKKATGPLAVEWRKLELKSLQKKLKSLKAKCAEYTRKQWPIPVDLKDEVTSLEKRLIKPKIIWMKTKEHAEVSLDVPNYEKIVWNIDEMNVKSDSEIYQLMADAINSNAKIDMKAFLEKPSNGNDFVVNFPRLCQAIYNKEMSEEDQKNLLSFCEKTIVAYRNYENDTNKSNLEPLCAMLYSFMQENSQDKFKQATKDYNTNKRKSEAWNFKPDQHYEHDHFYFGENRAANGSTMQEWFSHFITLNHQFSSSSEITFKGYKNSEKEFITTVGLAKRLAEKETVAKSIDIKPLQTSSDYAKQFFLTTKFLDTEIALQLKTFYAQWAEEEKRHLEQMQIKKDAYKKSQEEKDFLARSKKESDIDNEAGEELQGHQKEQLKLAVNQLGNAKFCNEIYAQAVNKQKELEFTLENGKKKLIECANKTFDLTLLGQRFHQIAFTDLLRLFLRNDLNAYKEVTRLDEESCIKLHNDIANYLTLSTHKNHFSRIIKKIDEYPDLRKNDITEKSAPEAKATLHAVGELLTEINTVNHQSSPALIIFQNDQEIFVRPQQNESIESLLRKADNSLEFQSRIIQLIMGAGKTTVLLPVLALQQATGDNLCMIEVPEALYETNLADLNNISFRLFGQRAYGFHFDRNSPSDHLSLKARFRELEKISENRDYLVTTKESMASLELKYHELLKLQGKIPTPERAKAIKWLDKIINFRKKQGDCLADEVDSTLDISQQINYTVGESERVPSDHVESTLELFEFINSLSYEPESKVPDEKKNMENMLSVFINSDALSPDIFSHCLKTLAEKLINNPKSPLAQYLPKTWSKADQDEMVDYLLNKTKVLPKVFSDIHDPAGMFRLKYFKGQLNHLLQHTLSLKYMVNYGPSEALEKTPEQRAVTIPFAGNNEPREKSKDTNHFKTINLSIQGNLITGIPESLLGHLIGKWREAAQKEFVKNQTLSSLDDTEVAKNINAIFEKIGIPKTLMTINVPPKPENQTEAALIKKLSLNREFIFYVLKNEILPTIKIDSSVIVHNAQNHVTMYRSFRGVTGTPSNSRTMHQSIKFNAEESLGTDGLTIARLIDKETKVHILHYKNPAQFLEDALNKTKNSQKIRCIIDIAAMFKGVENKQVVDELSVFISKNQSRFSTPLKYILYFDKESVSGRDELYALPVGGQNSKPISLKGKDKKEIKTLLGCGPEACFTYYDQKHTIGTDIAQAPDAIAIVTVDKDTLKKDACQGIMRLRGFGGAQEAVIFTSDETATALGKETLVLSDVVNLWEVNQRNKLIDAHFTATLEKMKNIIREDLQSRILSVPYQDIDKKAKLQSIFEDYFISNATNAIVESYGAIETEPNTIDIFNSEAKHLLEDWKVLVKKAGVDAPEILETGVNEKTMGDRLSLLISESLPNCKKKTKQVEQNALSQTAESQQQAQAQQQQAVFQQQKSEVQVTRYDKYDRPSEMNYWTNSVTLMQLLELESNNLLFETSDAYKHRFYKINPLRSDKGAPLFDSRFRDSYNFHRTTSTNFDNAEKMYKKQILIVLMIQNQGILTPILLTSPEAGHLKKLLKNPELPEGVYIWLSHPNGKFISGKKPEAKDLDPAYDGLAEQMTFYNGELISSPDVDLTTAWIMENYDEKLNYFENSLLPFSLMPIEEFKKIKNEIYICQAAFERVAAEENTKEQTHVNWDKEFPLLNAPTRTALKEFSEFLQVIDNKELKEVNSVLLQKFSTPFYFKVLLKSNNSKKMNQYLEVIKLENLRKILLNQFESALHYAEVQQKEDVESLITVLRCAAIQKNPEKLASCFLETLRATFKCSSEYNDSKIKAEQKILVFSMLTDKAVFSDPEALIRGIPLKERKLFLKTLNVQEISILFQKNSHFAKLLMEGIEPAFYKELSVPSSKTSGSVFVHDSELFDFLLENADSEYLSKYIKIESNISDLFKYIKWVTDMIKDKTTLSKEDVTHLSKCDNVLKKLLPLFKDGLEHDKDKLAKLWNYAFSTASPVALQFEGEKKYSPLDVLSILSENLPPDSFSSDMFQYDSYRYSEVPDFDKILNTENGAVQNFFFDKIQLSNPNEEDLDRTYCAYLVNIMNRFEQANTQDQKPFPEIYYRASAAYLFYRIHEQLKDSAERKLDGSFEIDFLKYLTLSKAEPRFFKSLSDIIIVNEYDKKIPILDYLREKAPEMYSKCLEHLQDSNAPKAAQLTQPYVITVTKPFKVKLEQDIDQLYQRALTVDKSAFSKVTEDAQKISKYQWENWAMTCNDAIKFILLHPGDEALAKKVTGGQFLGQSESRSKPLDPVLYGCFLTLASPAIVKIVEAQLREKLKDDKDFRETLTTVLDKREPLPLPSIEGLSATWGYDSLQSQKPKSVSPDDKNLGDRPKKG
jgi:hypothetical protein